MRAAWYTSWTMGNFDKRRISIYVLGALAASLLAWYYWLGLTNFPAQVNDDVTYLTLGKSLATGQGYRDLYLPGAPPHVSYPPLYPLALAGVWWLFPDYPANLLAFKALNIVFALGTLALMGVLAVRVYGMPAWQAGLAVAIYALGNVVVIANDLTMSEALFALLFVAGLLGIERLADAPDPPHAWAAPAIGLLAVVPLLTRTIGLCLPVATVIWLFARGQRRLALQAGAWAAALFAPWVLYVRHARAEAVGFDYVGWTVSNTGGLDPMLLARWAVDHVPEILTRSMPQAVAPSIFYLSRGAGIVVSAMVLAGLVCLARPRIRLVHVALAGYFAIILPFPWETSRYVAAIAPLLVIAFVRGAVWPAEAAFHAGIKPVFRSAAVGLAVVLLLAGLGGAKRVVGIFRRDAHHDALLSPREQKALGDYRAIADWATRNLPAGALWVSTRAPLWYLWTGHTATFYEGEAEPAPALAALWRSHEAYVIHPGKRAYLWKFGALLDAHPEKAELVFTAPSGTVRVYRMSRDW